MFDELTRQAIAHKRFSLISPVINKQVDNNIEYFRKIASKAIEMPYYGVKKYSPKTIESWYCTYMKGDIEALKPSIRGDKGRSRRISEELGKEIKKQYNELPKAPIKIIYEKLVKDNVINPEKISYSTVCRFIKNKNFSKNTDESREVKRFSQEFVNEQWQSDLLYGPYIKNGRKNMPTYLIAYIDDCSRLITHAEFFYTQGFEVLRSSFKEAVLKRGIPKTLYTDNGKIYRSQQLEWMCARLGCLLAHSKPFVPRGRGKIERFFLTVRRRFLSNLDYSKIENLDDLNFKFSKWLDNDYQRKYHSSLGEMSPLDKFYSQLSRLNLPDDPKSMDEKFYLTKYRKVNHDSTFSMDKILYEVDQAFAKSKIELRYEPEWVGNILKPLLVYENDKKVSTARMVDFNENSNYKRRGRPKRCDCTTTTNSSKEDTDSKQTISFKNISEEDE
jgi:putative transposase